MDYTNSDSIHFVDMNLLYGLQCRKCWRCYIKRVYLVNITVKHLFTNLSGGTLELAELFAASRWCYLTDF